MTSVCILQISDLHRDQRSPIGNNALLASLDNDSCRYTLDNGTAIRRPDVIVVSGDIVHGIPPGSTDAAAALASQYREALDFLGQLADRFVAGNRQRVVIIPGNHDVSADHVARSVRKVDIAAGRKRDLVEQLFTAESKLRWSWMDFDLFEVVHAGLYAERLAPFAAFYREFYGGRTYSIDPAKQFDIFDYPEFGLTIAAFSSCFNNDLMNKQGAINPGCIAEVSTILRDRAFNDRLRVAVWHHNTEGTPMQLDYMNAGVLQNLIDCGFSVGLHGHQHRPQFLDTRFQYGGERRITVLSAGTLCGGPAYRYARAYNLIELDMPNRRGRLHVREMQNDDLQFPIWAGCTLPPDSTVFLEFRFDPPPPPLVRVSEPIAALLEAQKLYDKKDLVGAVKVLDGVIGKDALARPLLLECLLQLSDMTGIVARFTPPQSDLEAIHVMDALWKDGRRDELARLLDDSAVSKSVDPSVVELRTKYAARLK